MEIDVWEKEDMKKKAGVLKLVISPPITAHILFTFLDCVPSNTSWKASFIDKQSNSNEDIFIGKLYPLRT